MFIHSKIPFNVLLSYQLSLFITDFLYIFKYLNIYFSKPKIFFKMKRIMQLFQQTVKNCNVFTSPVNLRYNLDPDYNTVAGGIVSIGLIILLFSVFFNAWLTLLNKQDISSTTQTIREFDPQYLKISSDNFMFAIGVGNINLSDTSQRKYFDLKFSRTDIINGTKYKTNVPLQICSENHWEQLGDEFVQTFRRQKLSTFLCIPRNYSIQISGKYTSQKFIYYKISLDKCTGSNCRNQSQIDSFVLSNTAFSLSFYYSNTLINPDQQEPISQFFQDKDYFMFSSSLGTQANLYLGQYIMNTDQSIYPWVNEQIKQGFIIIRTQKQTWDYLVTPTQSYSKLYLRKSNIRTEISRKFRKVDDMLSYIGGLFGIFAVFFGLIMNYYGQCSFQLEMCQKIFDYQNKKNKQTQNGQKNDQISIHNNVILDQGWQIESKSQTDQPIIQPKQFGFIDFILHFIYKILKIFFNINWKRMQVYQESLQQMRYKLDVSQILEKISFYDRSFLTLFDQHQLKLLYLQEKFNFNQVRQQRALLGMRKDIITNLFGMVAQNIPIKQDEYGKQKKKTLKEINQEKSRKRLQTFVGQPLQNVFDILAKSSLKKQQQQDKLNLPPDIKDALKKLQEKIEKDDQVSIRIYNGLQYQLLQAYENSKSRTKKTRMQVRTGKKISKKLKIKQPGYFQQEIFINDVSANQSIQSIQKMVGYI